MKLIVSIPSKKFTSANLEKRMRKIIVAEFISLDGVIQGPGGPEEDSNNNFRLGGWQVPYDDDAIGQAVDDLHSRPFELLLGRRTYDIWAPYWPNVEPGNPIADLYNSVRKHVVTHRPDRLDWQNSHALKGNLADTIRALKSEDGLNLLTWGSADVVRQLLAAGLVDELRLQIYPVILGPGKRLFGDNAQPSAFALSDSTITPGGVVLTRYVRSGEVQTGTHS
jgi:dihydrofolate reductase